MIHVDSVNKTFVVRRRTGRLRRTRSLVHAVRSLSFSVEAGEFVGYLGPNGAGKSTTIKMLVGVLTPTSGSLRVAGLDPSRRRTQLASRIGVVFGQRTTLWWDLPLRDSLELIRHIYRVDAVAFGRRMAELSELLSLGDFLDTPVRQLSLGQRMRGDLTAALLHDPPLVILDEPTIGLDVISKAAVRSFLLDLNTSQGTTVLLTTHDLGDIERLCKRALVIDHGQLAFDGTVAGLRATAPTNRILVVDLAVPDEPVSVTGARVQQVEGPRQWLALAPQASAAAVIAALTAQHDVVDIMLREPDIEEVVTRLYSRRSDQ